VPPNPIWYFKEKQPDDTIREPIQGEFFATEAIRNSAEALVRESIQNSLDARLPGERVEVRFFVSGDTAPAGANTISRFTQGLLPHLKAKNNGLRDIPNAAEPCRFLVVEDFGTSGLVGDVSQWKHIKGIRNDFYSFLRAEGQSDKSDSARGRWGIGKFVFPRVSRASCFFAVTKGAGNPAKALMGRAILRSHEVGDVTYVPDGYFGTKDTSLVLPVALDETIKEFSKIFRLSRNDESGLSVVVPWYDDSVSIDSILTAVIRDYYYAVMSGQLKVVVEDPVTRFMLDSDTIDGVVETRAEELRVEMRPFLTLAKWSLMVEGKDRVTLQSPSTLYGPAWEASMIPPSAGKELQSALNRGENVALRVPLLVKPKKVNAQQTHFDVFLMKSSSDTAGRVTFIREGIIVTAAGGKRPPGINALVVIDKGPLANLLGDAENPAHTEWRKETSGLQEKYSYAANYLVFVKQSVGAIARFLSEGDVDPDKDLLLDVFSLPPDTDDADLSQTVKPKAKQSVENVTPVVPQITARPRRFQLVPTHDGFTITEGAKDAIQPTQLLVSVGYDVRGGSPLKQYHEADFNLARAPISIRAEGGAEISVVEGNHLIATLSAIPFRITAQGFDPHRDLFVQVIPRDEADGDSAS
jgi:hypothetical protein